MSDTHMARSSCGSQAEPHRPFNLLGMYSLATASGAAPPIPKCVVGYARELKNLHRAFGKEFNMGWTRPTVSGSTVQAVRTQPLYSVVEWQTYFYSAASWNCNSFSPQGKNCEDT